MKKKFLPWGFIAFTFLFIGIGCYNAKQVRDTTIASIKEKETVSGLEVKLSSLKGNFSIDSLYTNTNPHYFNDVTVYLQYATTPFFTYPWYSTEIADNKKLIPSAGIPSLIFTAVNAKTIVNRSFMDINELISAYRTISIESQNIPITIQEDDTNGNLAGTYSKSQTVFLWGLTPLSMPHPTLDNTRQSTIEVSSSVSRFELGRLKSAVPSDLLLITIDAVYVNNYYTTLNLDDTVNIDGIAWENNKPIDGHWSKVSGNENLVTSNDETMCYAFQVFPDVIPQFIYEVSGALAPDVQLQDGTIGAFSGKYVTITGFEGLSESSPPVRHTIYKVGLTDGGIPIGIDNITNSPGIGMNPLEVAITVVPWSEETITPQVF